MQKQSDCTTEYRNEKNNRKVSKIIARRKRTNQDGDENEKKRTKTNEDAPWIINYKVNLSKKKEGNEMKCKCYYLMTLSATAGSLNSFELN
jgi:hypothetical protein